MPWEYSGVSHGELTQRILKLPMPISGRRLSEAGVRKHASGSSSRLGSRRAPGGLVARMAASLSKNRASTRRTGA